MASALATTTTPPRFRLLLHGQDGSIPYLTPELIKLIFCPDDDGTSSSSSEDDCCWRWHRQHFILGVAVKDTCVTPIYREASSSSTSKKRKRENNDQGGSPDGPPAIRTKKDQSEPLLRGNQSSEASPRTATTTTTKTSNKSIGTKGTNNGRSEKNGKGDRKKPAGYTFLTPSKSSQICTEIHNNSCLVNEDDATTIHNGKDHVSNNYMHAHLRIPQYISTMIVPTFSLDYPENDAALDDATKETAAWALGKNDDDSKKKYVPKKQQPSSKKNNNSTKQNQQQQAVLVIPKSTVDTMPVNTPHGWQKLRPEQYWDAVVSLTATLNTTNNHDNNSLDASSPSCRTSTTSTPCEAESCCEGAVGMFDHMGVPRDQINDLFAKFMSGKSRNNNKNNTGDGASYTAALTPRAQRTLSGMTTAPVSGKWDTFLERLVQRTNVWSFRTQNHCERATENSISFWTPVHMAASHLPLSSLFTHPRSRGGVIQQQQEPSNNDKVAIVGWDAITYSREHRRQALRRLTATIQSASPTPKRYLVLSLSDLQSMLDAAQGGISIIGTDIVRKWSRDGRALCLDLTWDNNNINGNDEKGDKNKAEDETTSAVGGGMIDLGEDRYARDSSPLLTGCKCLACRPRRRKNCTSTHHNSGNGRTAKKMSVPSFTRAYIHHLIRAKEMLAQTLLFVHNLHQVLFLLRQLSKAALSDDSGSGGEGSMGKLDAFCRAIESRM